MLAFAFFRWWYGAGWLTLLGNLKRRLLHLGQTFSIGLLLRTLFKPWKQVVALRDPNATIGIKFREMMDNLVSRFVGFWVRVFTLIAAGVVTLIFIGVIVVFIAIWPLLPFLSLFLVIKGIGLM